MSTTPVSREDSSTRAKVIEAAVTCILERGFYRATSNEIGRRAGVTWGVIQYHFGTREALLVATLEESANRLEDLLNQADVSGPTTEARIGKYLAVLAAHYGRPAYLVSLQIILNLSHDPATSAGTMQTLVDINQRVNRRIRQLQDEVVGVGRRDPVVESMLFHACRGLAMSHLVLDSTMPRQISKKRRTGRFEDHASLLVRALAGLVEGIDP